MARHGAHGRRQRLGGRDRHAARRLLRNRGAYDLCTGRWRDVAGPGADPPFPPGDGEADRRVSASRSSAETGGLRMPKLTIDGREVEVPAGYTILQACEHAGIEVAHFCYHERLAIAGNCRMCLVEVEKSPKPIASCAMAANDGNGVPNHSPKGGKARKRGIEFPPINQPPGLPNREQ